MGSDKRTFPPNFMLSEIRIKKRFRYKTTESFDDTLQKVSRVSRGVLICQRLHGIDFLGHEMGYHQKLLAVVTERKKIIERIITH